MTNRIMGIMFMISGRTDAETNKPVCNRNCNVCHAQSLSCVRPFSTPWTVTCQAPPSMGFFRQEYWNSPAFQADSLSADPSGKPRNCNIRMYYGKERKKREENKMCIFFSGCFKILSSLTLKNLIMIMTWCGLLHVSCAWGLLGFLNLGL